MVNFTMALNLNNFENETMVKTTKRYDLFEFIEKGNRKVQYSNVEDLKYSISKKYITVPIIVTFNIDRTKFIIGDGQHRFLAAKELGLPIRFIVVPDLTMNDIQSLNSTQINWNVNDFLQSYIDSGNHNYLEFKIIQDTYKINYKDILFLIAELSENETKEKYISKQFKDGNLNFDKVDKVVTFLEDLKLFENFDFYNSTSFVRAFFKLYASDFYDRDFLKKRISQNSNMILSEGKQINIYNYCDLLQRVYSKPTKGIVITYNKYGEYFEKMNNKEKRRVL
ncbi:ParB/RepB/Spo0J family partition protein [Clostridium sp. ZBS18]|uniref:ParB/RepB/Spo0J family partition protein n=1 Tax=Clostridium sp. ZBS18 TaxID=2949967 RepID=UPI00207A2E9B|nr:ParB/RepB/Spo0J family partition protein [Clostridium sp. ZBS18]